MRRTGYKDFRKKKIFCRQSQCEAFIRFKITIYTHIFFTSATVVLDIELQTINGTKEIIIHERFISRTQKNNEL